MSHGQHGQRWNFTSFSIQKVARPSGTTLQLAVNSRKFHRCPCCPYTIGRSGVAEWARELTGDRTVKGSSPAAVITFRFGTLAIPFTPPCQCLSDETLKAVGPFYLVSMPGEVKDPTSPHWNV